MFGIKLVKKLSDGVLDQKEIAEVLGLEVANPTKTEKSSVVTHRKVTKLPTNRRGRKPKTVLQYTRDGEYLASYVGASEAAHKYSISCNAIRNCAMGKAKTAAGYQWRYR